MKKKPGKIRTPSFFNRFAKIRLKSESNADRWAVRVATMTRFRRRLKPNVN